MYVRETRRKCGDTMKFIKAVSNISEEKDYQLDENGEYVAVVKEKIVDWHEAVCEFIPVDSIVKIYLEHYSEVLVYVVYDEAIKSVVEFREKLPEPQLRSKLEYLERYLCDR